MVSSARRVLLASNFRIQSLSSAWFQSRYISQFVPLVGNIVVLRLADSTMAGKSDWISAGTGLVASVIALVTLFTVYVAALHLLSERRAYRHSLSHSALGAWKSKVLSSSWFGLRTSVSTPSVSIVKLIKQDWSPQLVFPLGIPKRTPKKRSVFRDIEKGDEVYVLARSSWVNFMQALGLSSDDTKFFDMQYESALLAGYVPMRWRGPDLVGLCAMLGFQSHEGKPSFSSPMELPLQWTGPLGWVQFRGGFEGCVAEFRRRNDMIDQLSNETCNYFRGHAAESSCALIPRLCYAMGGFCIDVDGQETLFYVGPQDFERTIHFFLEAWNQVGDKDGKKEVGGKSDDAKSNASSRASDSDGKSDSCVSSGQNSAKNFLNELESASVADDEILEKLWGMQPVDAQRKGTGVRRNELRGDLVKSAPEEMKKRQRKDRGLKESLLPCSGLLSVVIQGEMATTYGLEIAESVEYHRIFSLDENVTGRAHPYHLGNMYMDREALKLFKIALAKLKPDGFYFCPTGVLAADINDIYTHVGKSIFGTDEVCPDLSLEHWNGNKELYYTVKLCNEMQARRRTARATFSVADMAVISKASACLQKQFHQLTHLSWALLVCPALFTDMRVRLKEIEVNSLKTLLLSEFEIKSEVLISCELKSIAKESNEKLKDDSESENSVRVTGRTGDEETDYIVPECPEGIFSGEQVVAAFFDVCLTFYWIEKKWVTDVSMYTAAIPPTVMML